ncbi:S8 family serine peptidase [Herbaspirillum frisingense]|uniref:S8 family serine peptidase n=1 Tax=Herbaspirillum frisingense TaxID=92645 RepID=UPI001F30E9DA|nr:S8 family serine peptidase [Herbaspirillum frisingense]UIN19990.1 S8 family serine peptidase [Herbaspirillum frisingense]
MNIKKTARINRARAAAPTFKNQQLYCAVLMTLAPALAITASAQSFVNFDGSRTNDKEAAAATWANAEEFKSNWGLGAMNAQHAYAAGFSGRGIKLGAVDSGLLLTHEEFAGRAVKALPVAGVYANDGSQQDESGRGWKAGQAFNTTGAKSLFNDNHGSHVSGTIAAAKNGAGMMGVAFDSDYHVTNSNGTDGSLYGVNMDYNYFKAAYGNLAAAGVRAINSSWGSPDPRDDFGTLAGVAAAYDRLQGGGKKSWLDAAVDVARESNVLHVWAAGNAGRDNVNIRSALPYFRPEMEQNWITVTALTSDLVQPRFSNRCGLAKYWCVSAPGAAINSLESSSDKGYEKESGTSMAAPHVTGALGLLMERYPTLDNQAIRTILLTTAKHLGTGASDVPNTTFGWGIPDLNKALNGPGQLLGRFNAHLPAGLEDTWSNNISEAALVRRKAEEKQALAEWRVNSLASLQAKAQALSQSTTAKTRELVSASYEGALILAQALRKVEDALPMDASDAELEAYDAAMEAVRANKTANVIFKALSNGQTVSMEEIIKAMVDADQGIVQANQAIDNYRGQTAYMNHVANKTDADYAAVLVKTGAGTLTLTGDNSYSGGTLLQGGTLGVGSNTALGSGPLSMSDGTTLRAAANKLTLANAVNLSGVGNIDTQAHTMTLSGAVTDGAAVGSLVKRGRGTLILTGVTSYSGNTSIADGTLAVSNYSQKANQILSFGASSETNYGKLQVSGRASFMPQAKLAVDVASVNTLGKGQKLAGVISAGTLEASSFAVADNSLLFDFNAAISGNSVNLDIVDAVTLSQVVKEDRRSAATGAAAALDQQIQQPGKASSGDMSTVVSALGRLPDAASVSRAVNQSLPRNTNAAAIMGSLSSLNRIVASRFAPAAVAQGGAASGLSSGESADRQAWIMPFDARVNQGDRDGAAGFSANTWGLAGGIEGDLGAARVGLSYAYGNTNVSGNTALSGTGSKSRIESNVVALYASLPVQSMTLGLQVDAGWNVSRSQRELRFGGLNRSASADYGSLSTHAGASLSQVLPLTQSLGLVPALELDYTRLQSRAYTERGADALNLQVEGKTAQALVLGVETRLNYALSPESQISTHLGAGYDAINDRDDMVVRYAGVPGPGFSVPGSARSPWLMKAGISYTVKAVYGTEVSLRYDADGRSGIINQSAAIKASWRF